MRRRSLRLPVLHTGRVSSKSKMEGGANEQKEERKEEGRKKGGGKEGIGILFELPSSQCGLIHVTYGMGR